MKKIEEKEMVKNTFPKESILKSSKYKNRQDLLKALLKDKEYSWEEVDALVNNFLKGKVK